MTDDVLKKDPNKSNKQQLELLKKMAEFLFRTVNRDMKIDFTDFVNRAVKVQRKDASDIDGPTALL